MIFNGAIPTTVGTIFTAPQASPANANSGAQVTVNFFRVVNESAAARTFTIYLNVNGTARAITPVSVRLTVGAAYDDIPTIQLAPGNTVVAVADNTGVVWTLNVA
jgi:hypothetical protein